MYSAFITTNDLSISMLSKSVGLSATTGRASHLATTLNVNLHMSTASTQRFLETVPDESKVMLYTMSDVLALERAIRSDAEAFKALQKRHSELEDEFWHLNDLHAYAVGDGVLVCNLRFVHHIAST